MHYHIKPWAHQLEAIEAAKNPEAFAFFFDVGAGKTLTTINTLRHKAEQNDGLMPSTLILCPAIVIENWKREIRANWPEVPESDIVCLTGSAFQRLCAFEDFVTPKPRRIVITNYEALYMLKLNQKFVNWKPECVVLDESHKIKELSSKRTKRCIALGATARYRYILSGTPILNGPMDIFSQYLFLDKGVTFGDNFWNFRSQYFIDHNARRPKQTYFPNWQPREGALEAINKKIYTKAMRVMKKDCLDLPPLVRQTVEVEMTGEQLEVYKSMESDAVVFLRNNVSSADLAIKKALRLQQIVSGFVTNDDGKNEVFHDNERIKALEEVLDGIGPGHKVIIWAVFRENYSEIRKLLSRKNITFVEITGDTKGMDRQKAVDLFCEGTARILLGNPSSAGIGVNLVEASYAVYYSRNFSLEADLQSEARNYRGGSERHERVTRIDIVARGTIDEVVLEALKNKQNVSEAILQRLKGTNGTVSR